MKKSFFTVIAITLICFSGFAQENQSTDEENTPMNLEKANIIFENNIGISMKKLVVKISNMKIQKSTNIIGWWQEITSSGLPNTPDSFIFFRKHESHLLPDE